MHFSNNSDNATSISDLFIKAITYNEKKYNRDEQYFLPGFVKTRV